MRLALLWASLGLAGQPSKLPDDDRRAARLWAESCMGCHGARGLGDGPLSAALGVRPIAGRPFAGEADVALLRVGAGRMPGFGDLLDAGDAARVLSWLSRLDPATGLLAGESAEDAAAPPPPEGEGAEEDGEGGG